MHSVTWGENYFGIFFFSQYKSEVNLFILGHGGGEERKHILDKVTAVLQQINFVLLSYSKITDFGTRYIIEKFASCIFFLKKLVIIRDISASITGLIFLPAFREMFNQFLKANRCRSRGGGGRKKENMFLTKLRRSCKR